MWLGLLVVLICLLLYLPTWQKKFKLWRWEQHLSLNKHNHVFQHLYAKINGFTLSKAARQKQDAIDYVYGEIEFKPFIALFSLCNPGPTTTFYDLGSGTGKAVIAAMMVFDLKKSCGIELLPPLHHCAQQQQQLLRADAAYTAKANRIEFTQANFLEAKLHDANIIFINATAFFGDTWLAASKLVEQTKPGTWVITTSKTLRSAHFKLYRSTWIKMSWGLIEAYIQQRS